MSFGMAVLVAAGAFDLAFAVFHLYFWRMFRWHEELPRLSALNRGVVQVLNLCLTFVFFLFAALCFLFAREILASELGSFLLLGMCVFWVFRLILQPMYFGLQHPASKLITFVFGLGALLHGYAWWVARSI